MLPLWLGIKNPSDSDICLICATFAEQCVNAHCTVGKSGFALQIGLYDIEIICAQTVRVEELR